MRKRNVDHGILAVVQLHALTQRVLLFDVDRKKVLKTYPLKKNLLHSCIDILQKNKSTYSALVAVFGAKRFSASRISALIINVCAQIWNKKRGAVMAEEDAPFSKIANKLSYVMLSNKLIIPQYTTAPNITKRKT